MEVIKKNGKWLVLKNNSVQSFHVTEQEAIQAAWPSELAKPRVKRGRKRD